MFEQTLADNALREDGYQRCWGTTHTKLKQKTVAPRRGEQKRSSILNLKTRVSQLEVPSPLVVPPCRS